MRIAHLVDSMSRSGGTITNAVRDLTSYQMKMPDTELSVFGIEDEFSARDVALWGEVPVRACEAKGSKLRQGPNMKTAITEFDPDIVHVHGVGDNLTKIGAAVSKETGARFIITPHGTIQNEQKRKTGLNIFDDRAANSAACFHLLSTSEAKVVRNAGYHSTISVIPLGVAEPPDTLEHLERPWSTIRDDEKTLLFLGGLRPEKGLEPLIDGWAQFMQEGGHESNWRFQVVGWSPDNYEESLRARCIERSLGYSINFPGPLFGDQRWAAYRHADVLIMPSLNEGLSVAILEAWACGIPVIMTRECNIPEGFNAGAALETSADPNAICIAIQAMISLNDNERAAMGKRGQELSKLRFNWNKATTDLNSVYHWLCRRAPQPACVIDDQDLMMLDIVA